MASGDTKTNQYLDIAANGTRADLPADTCCETRSQALIRGVAERIITEEETRAREDAKLQGEIDEIRNNPDVVDIVDTYADLQDYDTSSLTDKDIIRVISDETKSGLSSYYRWNSPNPGWNFVGVIPGGDGVKELSSADYNYPTANPDRVALWLLDNGLYTAPAGVMVAASTTSYPWYNTSDKTILVGGSDTVKGIYTFLNGKTDVVTTQVSDGTEADEYTLLKSNQVLQATGQSTTDTMSQKAITDALNALPTGGVTELTSADYNWPTNSPTRVAVWMLDNGIYSAPSADLAISTSTNVGYGYRFIKAGNTIFTWSNSGGNSIYIVSSSSGSQSAVYNLAPPTVVQTTGTSTTDVMSQNAVTSMVFADPATQYKIKIGAGTSASEGNDGIEIGHEASATGTNGIALGYQSTTANIANAMALGGSATAVARGSIALGSNSGTNIFAAGTMDISTTNTADGYNSSNYRLLTGLYDPQSAHDAATKGYVDPAADSSAPTSATVGRLGEIRIDTTTNTAYMCVLSDSTTPVYEWKQITA